MPRLNLEAICQTISKVAVDLHLVCAQISPGLRRTSDLPAQSHLSLFSTMLAALTGAVCLRCESSARSDSALRFRRDFQ